MAQKILPLEPQYFERVWGGQRLRPGTPPVGEAWIAYEKSRVRAGRHAGRTLADLAAAGGPDLLGDAVAARHGTRFPLLVKLLDCADWLSVQVHPNDEQARRLVGPGEFGKTEAWHFLAADPGASVIAGVKPGTSADALARAIRAGTLLDVTERFAVHAGETVFIAAGTVHALGPGLFLYEVQQVSDTTYRAYDWGRPASAGRKLHVEESVVVADPLKAPVIIAPPASAGAGTAPIVGCAYFALESLRVKVSPLAADTGHHSFHVLTVTRGAVEIRCAAERVTLETYETALVAGGAGAYDVATPDGSAEVLRASVPVEG